MEPGSPDPLAELDLHRATCAFCTLKPWTVCREAAAMLQRMTDELARRMAPEPVKRGEG